MTKLAVVDMLKTKRENLWNSVFKSIQKTIVESANAGYFPDFTSISKQVMSEVAKYMVDNPDISVDELIVMLQEKEPDKFCEKTMSIVERLCKDR